MIYIILSVCVILLILGFILTNSDYDDVGISFVCVGGIFAIVLLITLGCYNSTKSTADSQIKVYEEQNNIIMAQIEPLVEKYLNYEKETYSTLKVDSNTLVAMSMYPELKGDEFVQSQIKIIMENQKKITDLRLNKAKLNAYKLWIFMGE
jgi:hypothetical protein